MIRFLPLVALFACATNGPPPAAPGCASCHGTSDSIAPPSALGGFTATTERGVGAHQAHLQGSTWGVAISCDQCHLVPATVDSPGHIDTPWPAELTFGDLAGDPEWDGQALTCTNAYCHGATLTGGTVTTPTWTAPADGQRSCQACHGFPPPAPHPQDSDCGACHITGQNGGADPATHIDGILQVDGIACDGCHGSNGNPAPPTALDGATDPTDPGVGAHTVHLEGGGLGLALACETCHPVPTTLTEPTHLSSTTDVVFTGIAVAAGTTASYDPASQTCTVYCHDGAGAAEATPTWTESLGGACNRCHGFAPPAPHPNDIACADCHPSGPGNLDATHLDGVVQTNILDCASCHGTLPDGAPPPALNGATDTTDPGVGQHAVHLTGTSLTANVMPCSTCHVVPSAITDPGHNNGTNEVSFTGTAVADGFAATYDPTTQTCTVYCHGTAEQGGQATDPTWTDNQGGSCDRCHGFTPPAPHPTDTTCTTCHPSGPGNLDPTHLDGILQTNVLDCASCHGTLPEGAPPPALNGATATTDPGVGQHAVHLTGTSLTANPMPCSTCHAVPTALNDPGHYNGTNEVSFSGDAVADGFSASYDPTSQTCTVYCHGTVDQGGVATQPAWTDNQGGACNRCHGFAPPSPHPQNTACGSCHPSSPAALDATHLNGVLDL